MKKTGNLKLMQELNRAMILNTIREHGPISRSEVAKRLGLSPTTVTAAVSELMDEGFVSEVGTGVSSGGRKPILLRFNPDRKHIIAVSVTNSDFTIARVNLNAEIQQQKYYQFDKFYGDRVVGYITSSIREWVNDSANVQDCLGISIIVPGVVDAAHGIIRYNSKLKLKNVHLKEKIESDFGFKAWVENDVNAIAMAEKNFGSALYRDNMVYVKVGDGVGAGIIVNGDLLRGAHGGAGEFGHMSIDKGGVRCECGNKGCLENYVSWPAIYSRLVGALARGRQSSLLDLVQGEYARITPIHVKQALSMRDRLVFEVMEEVADDLAAGLVNLVNLFNPKVIILGGDIILDNKPLMDMVKQGVEKHAMHILMEELEIRPSSFGDHFELMGAAAIILQDIFNISLHT